MNESAISARTALSREFETYWRSIREGRTVPLRSAVTPRNIPKQMLPGIFIVSLSKFGENGKSEFRLAGTRFREVVGSEITGSTFDRLVTDHDRDIFRSFRQKLLEEVCGLWTVCRLTSDTPETQLIKYTTLPLKLSEEGEIDYLLGFLECDIPLALRGTSASLTGNIVHHELIALS